MTSTSSAVLKRVASSAVSKGSTSLSSAVLKEAALEFYECTRERSSSCDISSGLLDAIVGKILGGDFKEATFKGRSGTTVGSIALGLLRRTRYLLLWYRSIGW